MAEKRYYWLKLKENYFSNPKIKKLRKIAGGDTFTIIYLKMQLLSISSQGVIAFEGIENSFAEELSLKLDEQLEDVQMTLAYLQSQNLIEQNNNEFLLQEACKNIGSECNSAARVRLFRETKKQNALHSNASVTKSNEYIDKDIDTRYKRLDIRDIDIDNKKEKVKEKGETSSHSPLEKKNKKEQYIDLVQGSSLSTKMQEQILEWLEYKKWKYAEVGIKSLVTTVAKNVEKYGENAVCAVIVESMGNMWQGICWDKLGRKEQRQKEKEEAEYIEDGEYLIFKKTGARIHKETYAGWSRKDN